MVLKNETHEKGKHTRVSVDSARREQMSGNWKRFLFDYSSSISQVKCTAVSVPKADSVVWSFAGRELNFSSNNTPFHVQEEYTGERVVSTVTLLDPISTYFGDYNCTVTNSFGTDSVIIKLTAHSKFISIINDLAFSFSLFSTFLTLSLSLLLALCILSSRDFMLFFHVCATRPRKTATFSVHKKRCKRSRDKTRNISMRKKSNLVRRRSHAFRTLRDRRGILTNRISKSVKSRPFVLRWNKNIGDGVSSETTECVYGRWFCIFVKHASVSDTFDRSSDKMNRRFVGQSDRL